MCARIKHSVETTDAKIATLPLKMILSWDLRYMIRILNAGPIHMLVNKLRSHHLLPSKKLHQRRLRMHLHLSQKHPQLRKDPPLQRRHSLLKS